MMFGHVGIWWIILAGLAFSQEDFPFDRSVIAHGIAKHHFSEGMQYLYSVMSSSLFYDDISVDGRRIAGEGRRYSIDGSAVEQFTVATKMLPKLDNNTVAVEFAAIQLKRAITSFHASNFIYPTLAALEHVNWLFSLQGKNDIIEDRPEQFPHDDSIKQQRHIIKDMIDQSAQLINLGAYQEAYRIYDHIIYDMGVQFFEVYFNLAILYVRQGNLLAAIDAYQQALAIHPLHTKSLLNLGTIYQQCAQFEMAVEVYQMIIFIRRVVDIVTGEQGYTFMSDFYVHARSNLALTLFQQRQYLEGLQQTTIVLEELRVFRDTLIAQDNIHGVEEVDQNIHAVEGISLLIRRSSLLWQDFEQLRDAVTKATLGNVELILDHFTEHFIINAPKTIEERATALAMKKLQIGPVLPFDTMLYDLPLDQRLTIAEATSIYYYKQYEFVEVKRDNRPLRLANGIISTLRIGLISYDFNDHPTTHLIEGIFKFIKEFRQQRGPRSGFYQKVSVYVYAYGANDQSYFRQMLESTADVFVDIVALSHVEAFDLIHNKHQIDLLFDMQIHTLGNRLELTALRPAPTIINYLVFPGTSGSSFFDYIVADGVVVPVENAPYYSERIIYLPPTYQISYYPDDMIKLLMRSKIKNNDCIQSNKYCNFQYIISHQQLLRKKYQLPYETGNEIIFCNFNKLDKFEPNSFMVWMQILTMVPNSFLWMLKPSPRMGLNESEYGGSTDVMVEAIYAAAAAMGIHRKRIIFAERTSKKQHIERHGAADIFLDTFIYGAHSTATDALRGGLPVLTIRGRSFPERVAASLYSSFEHSQFSVASKVLVVDSVKEFVKTATYIARHPLLLLKVKDSLWHAIASESGLFDGRNHVHALIDASAAVIELERSYSLHQRTVSNSKRSIIDDVVIARRSEHSSKTKWNLLIGKTA